MKKARAPLVTIGIPVYNGRKSLERALDSALSQTFDGPYEIIVCNDGSDDTTLNIAKTYAFNFPNIVRAFSFTNRGVATTRNAILRRARGKYMMWLDADDTYFPKAIEQQVAAIEESESKSDSRELIVFSDYLLNGSVASIKTYTEEALKNILNGSLRAYLWSAISRVKTYQKLNGFNQSLHRSEDQDWLVRFILAGGILVHAPGNPVVSYTFSTKRNPVHVEESLNYIVKTYGSEMKDLNILDEFVPRRYWEISGFYRANKDWDHMWRCRGLAVIKDPENYFAKFVAEMNKDLKSKIDESRRAMKVQVEKDYTSQLLSLRTEVEQLRMLVEAVGRPTTRSKAIKSSRSQ